MNYDRGYLTIGALLFLFLLPVSVLGSDWISGSESAACPIDSATGKPICKPQFWDHFDKFCVGDAYCKCVSRTDSNDYAMIAKKKKNHSCTLTCQDAGYEFRDYDPQEETFTSTDYCTADATQTEGECSDTLNEIEIDFKPYDQLQCPDGCINGEVERICKKQAAPNPPIPGVKTCCNLNLKRPCLVSANPSSLSCGKNDPFPFLNPTEAFNE